MKNKIRKGAKKMSETTEWNMSESIQSCSDLAALVQKWGFLPLLKNRIPGFSVEEHTPPELWFAEGVDGPWEWKGPVIRGTGCAYGKFFGGKAGFISAQWYPDFANWRRDGYDYDARYEDGLASYRDKKVYDVLAEHTSLLSRSLREQVGIAKRGELDAIISRLQMQGYVVTVDFVYPTGKDGRPYSWGLAQYATPEQHFGEAFTKKVYARKPQESKMRMERYLLAHLPGLQPGQLKWITG